MSRRPTTQPRPTRPRPSAGSSRRRPRLPGPCVLVYYVVRYARARTARERSSFSGGHSRGRTRHYAFSFMFIRILPRLDASPITDGQTNIHNWSCRRSTQVERDAGMHEFVYIFPDKSEAKKGRGECRVRCQETRFHLRYTTLSASN
jgi:hypothetical protein